MANIELRFLCNSKDGSYGKVELDEDEVKISIKDLELDDAVELYLDKSTAIRFAKAVRTEIAKIQEGGQNG